MRLEERERLKYNLTHEGEKPFHHMRQINELLTYDSQFHQQWRECVKSGMSFLDVGVGAGTVLKYLHDSGLEYLGIDISDEMIKKLSKHGLNCKVISCHDMAQIADESYDVVQHLDGMEHIPLEWETLALKEQVRISRQYIFYANAMCGAHLDNLTIKQGLGPVHINIKDAQGWTKFYQQNTSLGYKIQYIDVHNDTFFIILKKQ